MPTLVRALGCVAFLALFALASCASYTTPGRAADFQALGITKREQLDRTDMPIEAQMARRPAASFPANIALVRVQDRGYYSYSAQGYGSGRFTIVTTRDVESDEHLKSLASLPQIRGIAPLNRLVVAKALESEMDLRMAAASVQADVLLLYTFDTIFTSDTTIPALGVISLGLIPNEVKRVTSTASAAFIDTRTGYVYGLCEATGKNDRLHNAWNSKEALENARLAAEREAFGLLVGEMGKVWTQVAEVYGPK